MKIIGLTGGIASGKNFIAEIFAKNGAVIFDADDEVHRLLELDKSVIASVKKKFPTSFINKKIERKILGKIVFSDKNKLKILEKIIHPEIRKSYQKFLAASKKQKKKLAVLNIPLLLESKAYKCDYIVAIVLPKKVQKMRFLTRERQKNSIITVEELTKKFEQIRKKQLSNLHRKKHADFVIKNDGSFEDASKRVKKFLQQFNLVG